jgi:Lon protease-like protein
VTLPTTPVPIFPLPGVFLYPHQVLPLHVFEPRYRQLVADLLDGPGRFVVGTLAPDATEPNPSMLPVAGLGEIMRHEKLPDGRYNLWVLGQARVRIHEVPSERLYRQVRCEPFAEQEPPPDEAAELAQQLRTATTARLKQPLPLPDTVPPALLADLLVQTLHAPHDLLQRFYSEPSVGARARLVLAAAAGSQSDPPHG